MSTQLVESIDRSIEQIKRKNSSERWETEFGVGDMLPTFINDLNNVKQGMVEQSDIPGLRKLRSVVETLESLSINRNVLSNPTIYDPNNVSRQAQAIINTQLRLSATLENQLNRLKPSLWEQFCKLIEDYFCARFDKHNYILDQNTERLIDAKESTVNASHDLYAFFSKLKKTNASDMDIGDEDEDRADNRADKGLMEEVLAELEDEDELEHSNSQRGFNPSSFTQ